MDYYEKYVKYKNKYVDKKQNGGEKQIIIDHVMFPVYSNQQFLKEVKKYWTSIDKKITLQKDRIFMYGKDCYIEHISVDKNLKADEQYWSNAICVELEKKYWNYFKDPLIKTNDFLTPFAGCGYFIVDPLSKFANRNHNDQTKDIIKIKISKKLKYELENLAGIKWKLPEFITTDENLLHLYDIVVTDDKNNLIGPYLQCNFPLVNKLNNNIIIEE